MRKEKRNPHVLADHFDNWLKKANTSFYVCISIDVLQVTLTAAQAAVTSCCFTLRTFRATPLFSWMKTKTRHLNFSVKFFLFGTEKSFKLTSEPRKTVRSICMNEIRNEPSATVPKWNFIIFLKLIAIGDWISFLFLNFKIVNYYFVFWRMAK